MANETSPEYANAVSNLMETVGRFGQMQLELVDRGLKSAISVVEPISKGSIDIATNAFNALNQALQSVSAAIAPKK